MSARRSSLVRFSLLIVSLFVFVPTASRVQAQTPPSAHHAGQWTIATPWPGRTDFASSVNSVHMALLRGDTLFDRPHSEVLTWGSWDPIGPNGGGLWAWNPATDAPAQVLSNLTPLSVPAPTYNLFCGGHAALPNGDLLVISGTARGTSGEPQSARFSALNQTWSFSSMNSGRWYGNGTPMADGRVLATGGLKYDHMVVFGGRRLSDNTLVSDVQRYAITNPGAWDPLLTNGPTWPAPREGHTLADKANGPYYLFGGKDGTATRNDVWQLHQLDNDLAETYRWSQLTISGIDFPATRWRHAAVVVPASVDTLSTMYAYGGERISGATTTTLNDLWRLKWRTDVQPNQWQWTELTDSATGDKPLQGRSGHSAFWDKDNSRMIMWGGQNPDGSITDTRVFVLTFPTNAPPQWKIAPPAAGDTIPAARTRHAMAANPKTDISTGILFGGLTANGLSKELWELTVTAGNEPVVHWHRRSFEGTSPAPAPRTDASIIVYDLFPTSYIVFGGDPGGGNSDASAWEYRFDTLHWQQLASSSEAVRGHMAIREQRELTALQPEVFDPESNTWSPYGGLKKRQSYHMMFLASDGKFYSPGPNHATKDSTWRFDPATGNPPGEWSLYTTNVGHPLDGTISGILYRPDLIMKCQAQTLNSGNGVTRSLPTGSASPLWRAGADTMGIPRENHILSILPTGEVIATGGIGIGEEGQRLPLSRRPEIWDPNHAPQGGGVGWWYGAAGLIDTLNAEPVRRGYHTSAVILPDGRILSAGGNDQDNALVASQFKSVDQYSPPYLFRSDGAAAYRPRLVGAQDHIYWNQTFEVACLDPADEACLIRPGAATHAFNQDCRYVPLARVGTQDSHHVTLRAPLDRNSAPPGNYLLFVLSTDPVSLKRKCPRSRAG